MKRPKSTHQQEGDKVARIDTRSKITESVAEQRSDNEVCTKPGVVAVDDPGDDGHAEADYDG